MKEEKELENIKFRTLVFFILVIFIINSFLSLYIHDNLQQQIDKLQNEIKILQYIKNSDTEVPLIRVLKRECFYELYNNLSPRILRMLI